MATSTNRFALSPLSRENQANAITGEMMIDKETGQILVKTVDGDVVSYDGTARLRGHVNDVTTFGQLNTLYGDLYSVELDNIVLPSVVDNDASLLPVSLTLKSSNLKRLYISVDVDTLEFPSPHALGRHEPSISLYLQAILGGVTTSINVSGKLSEVNTRIIDLASYFPPGTNLAAHSVKLTGLKVIKNTTYGADTQLRHVLHSVLVIVE